MLSGIILGGVVFVLLATALAVYAMYIRSGGDTDEGELHEETRASLEQDEIAEASDMDDDEEGRFQS